MSAGSTEAAGNNQRSPGKNDKMLTDLKDVLSGGPAGQPNYLAQLDKQSIQPPSAQKSEQGIGKGGFLV